jgi:hypothetical protein
MPGVIRASPDKVLPEYLPCEKWKNREHARFLPKVPLLNQLWLFVFDILENVFGAAECLTLFSHTLALQSDDLRVSSFGNRINRWLSPFFHHANVLQQRQTGDIHLAQAS